MNIINLFLIKKFIIKNNIKEFNNSKKENPNKKS